MPKYRSGHDESEGKGEDCASPSAKQKGLQTMLAIRSQPNAAKTKLHVQMHMQMHMRPVDSRRAVRDAVKARLADPSIRVREGAVDLIGNFVLGMGGAQSGPSKKHPPPPPPHPSPSSSSSPLNSREKDEEEEEEDEKEQKEEKQAGGEPGRGKSMSDSAGRDRLVFSPKVESRYVRLVLSRLRNDPGLSVRRRSLDVLRRFLVRR